MDTTKLPPPHLWDNDGGPAFPSAVDGRHWKGLSVRDWFAGQVAAGMMAAPDNHSGAVWDAYAQDAYALADSLLRARSKD